MEDHETVLLITPGQIKELAGALVQAVPLDMSSETAQAWIGNKGLLQDILRRGPGLVFNTHSVDVSLLLEDWQEFWSDLGQFDFSNIRVPQPVAGFTRAIIVPKGHTLNREYELCKALFPCWRWTEDLDSAVTENEREPKESYIIWVRDCEEADGELQNLSANDIKKKKLVTQILLERMIHGRKFFKETGRHLDTQTRTLCSGSRIQDGDVPRVRWGGHDGQVNVSRCHPDYSFVCLRARQVVSA